MGPTGKGKISKKSWDQVNALRKLKKKQLKEKKLERELLQNSKIGEEPTAAEESHFDLSALKQLKTVSIAVPGSILDNAQTSLLRTYLTGQIARAACIYNVDEIVVFNDMGDSPSDGLVVVDRDSTWRSCALMGRILQFLECPQYLRQFIFPMHKDFQYTGLLNPLDAPHHLRMDDECVFREGIISKKKGKIGKGSYANVGLQTEAAVDKALMPGTRVTVKLLPKSEGSKKLKGVVVPPSLPRLELGRYWGYSVRIAKSLSEVISGCPYEGEGGYDLFIGTSDKGTPLNQVQFDPDFKHCLIVFGGLQGLEGALEADEVLSADHVSHLFHHYVNTCPRQGTRTIRTEEAVLISLPLILDKLSL